MGRAPKANAGQSSYHATLICLPKNYSIEQASSFPEDSALLLTPSAPSLIRRHRSLNTSQIYAKLDHRNLAEAGARSGYAPASY